MSNLTTALKVIAVLGAVAGGAALLGSDNEQIAKFRENVAKTGGLFAGTAARAAKGNDISFVNGRWSISPHKEEPAKEDVISLSKETGRPYGVDLDKWSDMYYTDKQEYLKLIKMQQDHEIELKRLEVQKAEAEAAKAAAENTKKEEQADA